MIYQCNVAQMKYDKHAPEMHSFFQAVPHIQKLAEASPGFIWRETDEDDPTIAHRLGTDFIVNLSAWQSLDALYGFVFGQSHKQIMMARDQWFTHLGKPLSVIWLSDNTPFPSWDEAIDKLETLWERGPTQDAFDYSWAYANSLTIKSLEF